MGDPLSVGASAVGIISLGLTVSNGLLDYYTAFKDQPADVAQMIQSLQTLSHILEAIDRKVQHPLLNREAVHHVTESLISCVAGIHILQAKLEKIRNTKPGIRANAQRAKYPFQKKTLEKLAQAISVVQGHLNLAINTLQLDLSITSLVRHDDLKANLDEFHTDVVNRFARLDLGQEQETLRSLKSHEEIALNWLSQLEFHSKHNDAQTRRQKGTGQWFLQSAEFSSWVNTDARVLWCPGLPGAGKTILSSIVIDHLQEQLRQPKKIGIAFAYCVYGRVGHTASGLLANLLKQLALQTVASLEDITKCHERHSKFGSRPALKEISGLLSLQVQRFDEVFIIIDALDECPEADQNRKAFIGEVRGLLPKVRLMVTSRDIPSIEKTFHSDLQLHIRATDQDVKLFVESQTDQNAELSDLLEDHDDVRSMITATVVEKSRGMSVSSETSTDSGSPDDRFLVAVLHMDSLAKEDNLRDLKEALHRLPEDLYKTYDEALERINRQDSRRRARANEVLMLINCAKRPLKLNEMRQALSVRRTDKVFNPEALPKAEALISTCCGLVVVEEESQIVRLVHYTTEEYFERKQHDFRSPEAHQYFCGQLITYLGFPNIAGLVVEDEIARMEMEDEKLAKTGKGPSKNHLKKLFSEKKEPDLVIYGVENWGYHARQAFARLEDRPSNKSRDLEEQIDLYLRTSPNVGFAIRILCYLEERRHSFLGRDFWACSKGSTSLHTAATHGIYPLVEKYLSNGAHVNAADAQGRTALHSASKYGHVDIVQLLLDHGAAIDIQDESRVDALLHAVCSNRLPVARLLLQNGSDPCSPKFYTFQLAVAQRAYVRQDPSTFQLAAARGYQTMLELLIEYGTHSVKMSRLLGGALIAAVEFGQEGVVGLLAGNAETLNISGQDLTRATLKVFYRRNLGILRILLDAGVDVNQQLPGFEWPFIHFIILHDASDSDALALFLEKGANVNALSNRGDTALVFLAKAKRNGYSYGTMARQLLEAGADIKATDGAFNRTPLEWAVLRGSRDLVRLLLEWESPRSALGARARAGSEGTIDFDSRMRRVRRMRRRLLKRRLSSKTL